MSFKRFDGEEGTADSPCPCFTVRRLIVEMEERSRKGLLKYGVTAAENPLSHREWLQHQKEELMDALVYCQKALDTFEKEEK